MTMHVGKEIVPARYPELKLLVWNRDATRPIPREEALALYERNWRFVHEDQLTAKEIQLIDELKTEFGHDRLFA